MKLTEVKITKYSRWNIDGKIKNVAPGDKFTCSTRTAMELVEAGYAEIVKHLTPEAVEAAAAEAQTKAEAAAKVPKTGTVENKAIDGTDEDKAIKATDADKNDDGILSPDEVEDVITALKTKADVVQFAKDAYDLDLREDQTRKEMEIAIIERAAE